MPPTPFQQNIRFQLVAVLVGGVLLAVKFWAWWLTHSNAILTDALESIINVVAGCFALYSLILAAKPKDRNHPYGHGKIEFLSAGFEGTLIVVAGVAIIIKSIYNLFYPTAITHLDTGILLTAVAGLVNYVVGFFLERRGHETHSLTLIAGGKHLKTDAYSTVGLVVGLGVVYFTRFWWLDNVIAVFFGSMITITGLKIIRQSVAGIMDEADYELMTSLIAYLNKNRQENWIDIHNLRIIKYGANLHIDAHVTLPWYLSLKEAHDEVDAIEKLVKADTDKNVELFLHADPCIATSCPICLKTDCKVRKKDFEKKVEWELKNVQVNKKHG